MINNINNIQKKQKKQKNSLEFNIPHILKNND